MKLNDQGLPLPGRDLDEAIAKLLGYEVVEYHADATSFPYVRSNDVSDSRLCTEKQSTSWAVSTTHAFFQVMEAMELSDRDGDYLTITECWEAHDGEKQGWRVKVLLRQHYHFISTGVWLDDYPDREHAWAHAVCACTWKALNDTLEPQDS